ncbi:MAG: DUF1552 domain-containing protein [Deltaproteobacteria bacterium]|nr:DUF1552 domain-containing protein [Deltaproteobacteria bacterium]
MNRKRPIYRRQFLQGAGGVSLGLPFLPSLVSRVVHAADPALPFTPNLWWMTSDHGGVFETNFFPNKNQLNQSFNIPNGHTGNWGKLTATKQGNNNVVSPVLQAPSTALSDALVDKMNVLWGFDIPFYIGHHTGGHLGNYARNDGNGGDGLAVQGDVRPTLDHMLGWSPSFYKDRTGIRERHVTYGYGRNVTWNYSNGSTQSGGIQPGIVVLSSRNLFNRLIDVNAAQNPNPTPGPAPRASIADRVLVSYKRLMEGNRRLSARDKTRLSDHISQINELEMKLNPQGGGGNGAICKPGAVPTEDTARFVNLNDPVSYAKVADLYNDVVVAALACGTTRIAVFALGSGEHATGYSGNWHQDIAHQWETANAQMQLRASNQFVFEKFFVNMMTKLNAVETAPGKTLLDDTLMAWSQECGMSTHDSVSIPVVTAGSGCGKYNTGRFIDYRKGGGPSGSTNNDQFGLLWSHWLGSVAVSMGMPATEFERWGHRGIGTPFLTKEGWTPKYVQHYGSTSSPYFQMASDKLPILNT